MTRRYNLQTRKIYESENLYSIECVFFDRNGKQTVLPVENTPMEDTYSDPSEAMETTYDIMSEIAREQGIDEDDVVYSEDENNYIVTFTVNGIGKWVFTIYEGTNECGDNCNEDDLEECNECGDDQMKESVSARFARLRKMFESDEDDNDDEDEDSNNDDEDEDSNNDDSSDEDSNKTETNDEDDTENDDSDDEEMKAVILTVKKGDADKCKDELIDANIPEDDIEIIEGDDDAENDEIRVDVNSVMELKDYLKKKGIDLEEEIGGEIVSDDDDDSEDDDESNDNKEKEGDEDFDFDDLGDIFGAEDDEEK